MLVANETMNPWFRARLGRLISDINADELGSQNLIDVLYSSEHTFPAIDSLVTVSELQSLVDFDGGTIRQG
ncbi:hypothetical protein ACFXTH_007599 [Malus domestica]